jgi:DNA internalization-related competence protein ComEC/Rec2
MLPAAAVAFALGLLGSDALSGRVDPWVVLLAGFALLGGGWVAAGRHGSGSAGALASAGLVMPEPAAVEAVASSRVIAAAPIVAAVVSLAGILAVGAGWGGLHHRGLQRALLASLAPERVVLDATLKTDPTETSLGWSATALVRRVEWGDGAATLRSPVWVSGSDAVPKARRGDEVRLEGVLRVPDDEEFAEALERKGIPAQLQLQTFTRRGPATSAFVRATQSTREVVASSIERVFPREEAGLLLGLLLGDDSQLDPSLERDFRASGLSHLLVVSGGNVAMVLAPVLAATAILRLSRWPKFAVGFGAVAFFTILTGAEPSVLRAGVMACLALVGVLSGRPRTTASILSAAVLGLLVLDPWLVWSVGFQLSVTATAGMVALASPLADRFGRLLPRSVATAAGATISAQLGVTPILLYHFHEVPLVTLPANLAAFPLVAPSLLLGAIGAGAGAVWLPAGKLVGALALLPMRWLELVADHLGKAPVGYLTAEGGPLVLVGGTAIVAAIVVWIRTGWKPSRPLTAVAIATMPFFVWASALGSGPPDGFTVRFFDVGQGDAALITTPEGAAVLVDGGPERDQVATELSALGIKRLDIVVASHPHADHIVGLPTVLARLPVGLLLQPGCDEEPSLLQADLDRAIADEGVTVRKPRAGATFWLGSLRLDVLSPDRCWTGTESDANNDAIVIRATYRNDIVLIASEPEEPAQEWLLESGVDLRADILKVPHHGAATSVPEFFDAVQADAAIVSVGENDYGHPTAFTLDALAASGAQVWRTDRQGTITVVFAGLTPTVEFERWG